MLSPRPSRLVYLIPLILCLAPVQADNSSTRSAMADAMSRMMEAMGLFGSGTDPARSMYGGMPSPFGMPGTGMGMPGWPGGTMGMPFGGGSQMWDQFSRSVPGMSQMPQMPQMPWSGSTLEGAWEAAGGGLLLVQGTFYRLYAPSGGYVDGSIQVTADRVRMFSSQAGFDLEFEYAMDQEGRLVMRDQGGQLYLYRRLVLKGG
ncbi:MAG: hypothetical protein ACM3ST_06730 [Bdellovibrio bacteriovorus]